MPDNRPTPRTLSTAITRLGLSQTGAAKVLGVNPRTMRRWLAGDSEIPKWVPLALKGLAS